MAQAGLNDEITGGRKSRWTGHDLRCYLHNVRIVNDNDNSVRIVIDYANSVRIVNDYVHSVCIVNDNADSVRIVNDYAGIMSV